MEAAERKPIFAGERINTLEELYAARAKKRAVIASGVPCFAQPKPAAVVIMLQGEILVRILRRGLYYYSKPEKKHVGAQFHKKQTKKRTGKKYVFDVEFGGDMAAGLRPFSDTIEIKVASGDPGGDAEGEYSFQETVLLALREWYDGARVIQRTNKKDSKQKT